MGVVIVAVVVVVITGSTWCTCSRQRNKHCVRGDEGFLYAER